MNAPKAQKVLDTAEFDTEDIVEFNIKAGKDTGMVNAVVVCPDSCLYRVIWSNKTTSEHYGFELKKTANK